MTETPEEMYNDITVWLNAERPKLNASDIRSMWKLINHYRNQAKVLREAMSEIEDDINLCDWRCPGCNKDYSMKETDIALTVQQALAAT